MLKLYAGLAIAAVIGLVGGTYIYAQYEAKASGETDPFAQCRGGAIGGGDIGGPFTLIDGDGKTVTEKDVLTKPALVYFGYTFCPDVCPFDNARNVEAVDLLKEKGYDVTPVFITVDPERDTPEIMKDYSANLHPGLIGLTGSEAQVKAVAKAYKVYFNVPQSEDEFYMVDHTTFTYLMLPGTGFADFFKREATPEEMADRVQCYIDTQARL